MKSRVRVRIALEDTHFVGCERREIPVVEKMWGEGEPIWEIAERVERDVDEVAILIMDRVRKRFLRPRPGGVFGSEWKGRRERAGACPLLWNRRHRSGGGMGRD